MAYLIVRHKVSDYEKWKRAFDEHGATRAASGSKGGQLYRNANDPSEMIGVFAWSDLDHARQFAQSDDLRETMQRAGVADIPDIYFVEKVEDLAR